MNDKFRPTRPKFIIFLNYWWKWKINFIFFTYNHHIITTNRWLLWWNGSIFWPTTCKWRLFLRFAGCFHIYFNLKACFHLKLEPNWALIWYSRWENKPRIRCKSRINLQMEVNFHLNWIFLRILVLFSHIIRPTGLIMCIRWVFLIKNTSSYWEVCSKHACKGTTLTSFSGTI